MSIDAMVRKLDSVYELNSGHAVVLQGELRDILLAGKEEQPKKFTLNWIEDIGARMEELERRVARQDVIERDYALMEKRVAEQDEHIHDLEKIIRDGEVFDQMNEVIRKIHNRVCDLEGYGKDKSPVVGVDEWKCPHCGKDEGTWFERTISYNDKGGETGMSTRCNSCG